MGVRVARFADAVEERVGRSVRVLDFGCGSGKIAHGLLERGHEVTACDISPKMLGVARQQPRASESHWQQLDADEVAWPFEDNRFDAVISWSVFEYLAQPELTAREAARVLRPGGWLLLTVPDPRHRSRQREEVPRRVLRIGPVRRLLEMTPWSPYVTYLSLSTNRWLHPRWSAMLRRTGMRPVQEPRCSDALMLIAAQRIEPESSAV